MKYFLIALTLISITASSQQAVISQIDYEYIYNPTNSTVNPACVNNKCFTSVIFSGDTLMRKYSTGVVFFKAQIAAANIVDTLSASGITGICKITIPTTIGTQRAIQTGEVVYIFSSAKYRVEYADAVFSFPITVKKISDNSTMFIMDEGGGVEWVTQPQWAWLGRIGTTRLKRITLP